MTTVWAFVSGCLVVLVACGLIAVRRFLVERRRMRGEQAEERERSEVASALNLLMAHGFEPQDAFAMLSQARRDGLDLDAFARAAVAARKVPG
jgi:hypothetical protein